MIFLGCDPGLSGAIALWRPGPDILEIHDMPTLRVKPGSNKRTLDAVELARLIDKAISGLKTFAIIEQAGSRPGEGTASAHANGRHWGIAYGILCAQFIQVETVQPAMWKRRMSCPAAKDGALARAKQLLPTHAEYFTLKKHDGRAEAALIALYAERRFRQREVSP
jgi:crossover junction endodeoxyribonuclease RuvC